MQRGRKRMGRIALSIVAVVGASTAVDLAINESSVFAAYCGQSTDSFCGFGLSAAQQQPYCYSTEVPLEFTLTSQSTAPQPSSAQVSGTYTYPGGGTGNWRMNIVGPIATTTSSPYHTGASWGLNNAGNPYAVFNGDLGKTNLFLTPANSPASVELVQFRPNADADNLNGDRNTFANHVNHWAFDRTYAKYRLEDPTNQTTRNTGIYNDTALLYQRTTLDNRYSDYVVTGDSLSLWVQNHGGSAYEGWSQSAVAKYTTCLTVTQTGTYVDANNNGYPDPGDHVEFTYVLTNPGSAELSGINISDAGVSMNSSNITVAGGASVTVTGTYPLTAADILNGTVTRNGEASGTDLFGNAVSDLADSPVVSTNVDPEGDGEPDDPTTVTLPPPPIDLGVTKTDDADPVHEGDTITYTISVTNNGPGTVDTADTFIVFDDIPAGLIDAQYFAPAPAQWNGATGEISGVKLVPGETIELTVTAVAATSGTTVDNKVTVKSPVPDPDTSNDTATEPTTILPKADLKITKSATPSPVVAGTQITWTITVGNGGPNDATNVIVTDVIPPEVSSPTVTGCTYSGTSCNLGTITAGASKTITITATVSEDTPAGTEIANTATVASDTEDVDSTNDSAGALTPVSSEADVVLIKSSSPNPYVPGQPITYTFTVHNSGPSTAIGVLLKDTFPAGLSGFVADDPTCSFSGPDMACNIEKIGVGDTVTITVTTDTDPGLVDPIVNEAYVDVSNDPNLDNNVSVDENGAQPLADLRVVKSDLADPVLAGDSIGYTVSITNQGPSDATAVDLVDDFGPAGLGLALSGTPTITAGGGSCTAGGCTFPLIAVGETAVVTYTIDVPPDVASGTTVTNVAKVGSSVSDPDDTNNIAEETTGIKTQADLSITKVGDNTPVAGQNYAYTLTIANAGPSVAGTTVVQDQLPPGVTFVAAGSSPTCTASGSAVTCDVPSLAVGDQTEIVIEVTVDPAFVGTLANTATVAAGSNAPDPDTDNNTATHTGVASADADLAITKSVNKTSASAGTSLEWTVVVTNNGPSTATGVTVSDQIPAGVVVSSVTSDVSPSTCTSVSSCTLGDLAPGDVATITIVGDIDPGMADGTELINSASVSSSTTDSNPANDAAQVSTVVSSVADVSLVKTATPNPYTPGSPLAFTISTTNLGPSSAVGATFIDDLPANFAYTGYSVTAGSGTCSLSGSTLTCTADPMAPGAVFTVVVDGDTQSGAIAAMANTAAMATPTAYTDPEAGNDSSTVNVGSSPNADLGISKTPVGSVTTPGTTKHWTVTVTNSGPTNATGVIVTDTLPAGAVFVAATPSGGSGTCTHDGAATGGVITCELGDVPVNGVVSIDVETMLESSITDGAELTNTASVVSDIADANTADNTATATVTATRIADVAITKIDDPDPVIAGQPVTWKIVAANAGPSDAGSVVVTDSIPAGFTIESVTPAGCDVTGNDVSCSLGSITPGTPVEVVVVATASGTYVADGLANPVPNAATVSSPDDDNAANDQAQTTTLVVERSDVSITKSAPTEVAVGDTITWTIDVTNAGPSVAENVTVTDTIPPGIVVGPADVSGTGCTLVGNDVTCNLGTFAAGATTQIVITGSVPANYLSSGNAATVSNNAKVTSSSTDTDIGNNQAAVETVITEESDVNIAKSSQEIEAAAGEQITWVVEIFNNGPADARDVVVTDAIPAGFTLISATADNGGTCDGAGTCLLGTVPPDQLISINLVGTVAADYPEGPLVNSASVTSASSDPVQTNNTATATVNIVTEADLTVSKTGPTSAVPGQPISYTVTILNNGPSDATGVQMDDTLPAGLLGATASTDVGTCSSASLCDIGTLPAGETATITIDGTVDPNLVDATITNVVYALPQTNEPNPDDNDAATTASVTPIADVTLTKIGDVNPVIAGTNLVWTLTANNVGPSNARDVVIYDTLPPGVQLVSAPECVGTTSLECSIADLPAGESYSVTIEVLVDSSYYDDGHANPLTNTASIATATPELDTTNNTAVETTTVADLAGVAVGKSHEGFTVTAGETSTWLLTVVNTGPSSAQNVVVTDSIPAGTTFVSATASNGSTCTEDAGTLTCELGSIPLDGLVDIVVELDVSPDYVSSAMTNPIPNSASATSTTDDPNPADNTGVDSLEVVDSADLVTTKSGPAEVNAGDQIQWEVTVTNNGPSVASDVLIDDPVPAGVVIDSTSLGGLCDDFVICQVGDLAPGQSASVTITGTIDSTWLIDSYPQPLSNTANAASSTTPDPDFDNNSAVVDTSVTESAALTVSKTDSPDPVVAGEQITWVVSVTNDGPSVGRQVVVDDPVPAGVTVTSATASTGDACTFDVSCTLDTIAVGATETVTIVGVVDPSITATTTSISNTATVTSATNPDDALTATSDTAVQNRADLSVNKTDGGAIVTAGEPVNWSIAVTNAGPSDAPNTVVSDTLPDGLDLSSVAVAVTPSSAGTCATSALPDLTCDLGTVAAGATVTISVAAVVTSTYVADGNPDPMANTVVVSSDATETDPTNNTSTEQTPIEVAADLTLTKSGPATIAAGQQLTWTIDVGNLGPSAASGITIADTIPAGITIDSATPGCTITGQDIACDLAQLAVDSTHTVTVTGTVPADYVATGQPAEVTNGATVTSDVADPDATNNSSDVPTTIETSVDVAITKSVTPTEVAAGENATWTMTVTNAGPSVATDVVVTDLVPDGFTITSASTDNGGTCDAAATCLLGSVVPQGSAVITVEGTVDADAISSGGATPIVNTATVTATEADTDTSNNESTAELVVNSAADLRVVKVGAGVVVPGTTTEYTIAVTNDGPSDAVATTLTDVLPPELLNVTLTPATGTCTAGACDLGTIAAGETVLITVSGTVDPDTVATSITNTASATSSTVDPDSANNADSATGDVVASADVSINKTESVDPVIAGQPLTWTLAATNAGPSTARNVVISDILPPGVTLVDAGGCSGTTDLTCSAGDIAVGDTVTYEVTVTVNADYYTAGHASPLSNTATHTADTADPQGVNDEHTELTTVAALAGVAVGKSADVGSASAGTDVVWTITVINSGPSDAQNVVVTDPIPDGLSVTAATFDGSNCTVTSDIVCALGVVPVGGAVAITVTSTVDNAYVVDGLPDPLANTVTVTSDTDDPETGDNSGADQVTISAADDVSIIKQGPATAIAGGPIEWTVSVTNDGPSVAQNVVVSDPIPNGILGAQAALDPPTAGTCDPSVSCTIDTLAPGASVTVTITGTVSPSWIVDGRDPALVNAARVTSSADTNPANNEATSLTTIDDDASLSISKIASPEPVNAGQEITWTIDVGNAGPSAASSVVVTDAIPAGIEVTGATSAAGTCTFDVTCNLGDVAVGGSATITITGLVPPSWFVDGGAATVTNSASATSPSNPDQTVSSDATTTVARTADVSIVKTDTADPVVAGGPIRWVLTATNDGPSDATGVTISDTLPDGLDLTTVVVSPASANCDTGSLPTLTCQVGTMPAGTSVAVTVDATLTSSYLVDGGANPISNGASVAIDASIADPNLDNNADVETTDVLPLADVSIVKSADPITVIAGNDVTFTMEVTNAGPSTATGAVVADTLPDGITIVSAATDVPDSAPCPVAGQNIMCTIGNLSVGASATVTVVATVDANYVVDQLASPFVNTAQVTASSPDDINTNDIDTVDVTVVDQANVSITKTSSASAVVAGTALGWTVSVTNSGPSAARDVSVSDVTPDGYTVESINASNGASCDSTGCTLGTLGVGESVTIEIAGTTDPAFDAGSQTNTASVTSATDDPSPSDNTASATADVTPEADLAVTKTGPAQYTPGETVAYQILIDNLGPSTATQASLVEQFPAGFVVDSIVPSQGTCDAITSCALGVIEPGGQVTVEITGTADPASIDDFVNRVSVEAPQTDPDPANNLGEVVSTAAPVADVTITKDDVEDLVLAGEQLTWTLTAGNAGPSVARSVVIADTLPAGTTLVSTSVACDGTVELSCAIGDLAPGQSQIVTVVALVDPNYYPDGHVNPLVNQATATATTPDSAPSNNASTDNTTIAASAGLSIAKDANVASITAGQQIEWTLTAYNAGPSTGENVIVGDSLPDGVTFVSANASNGAACSDSGGDLTCELGNIAVGATVTIRVLADVAADYVSTELPQPLSNVATIAGDTDDPFLGDNTGVDQVTVTDAADLSLAKSGSTDAQAGGSVSWQITVTNDGPSVARAVTVSDPAPAGVTITGTSSTGGVASCTTAALCDLGDLEPGGAVTINLTGTVDSTWIVDGRGDTLINTASVSAATPDPAPSNNSSDAETTIGESATIVAVKTPDRETAIAGESVTWTIEVTNNGPSAARQVTIDDPAPGGTTIDAVAPAGACTFAAICTVDVLDVGETAVFEVQTTLDSQWFSDGRGDTLTNTATITTITNGAAATVAEGQVPVDDRADLSVLKTADDPLVSAGDSVMWTLTVHNDGPSAALDASLTDTIPAGVSNVNPAPPTGVTCDTGVLPTLTCTLGDVGAGATIDIPVSGTVDSSYFVDSNLSPLTNLVTVVSDTEDSVVGNNSASVSTQVANDAGVAIGKSAVTPQVTAGNTVSWTLEVANAGPGYATDVTVTDAIPAGVLVGADGVMSSAGTCTVVGAIECNLGAVAPGATVLISISGLVTDRYLIDQGATLTNTAAVATSSGDDPTDNSSTAAVAVVDEADLAITKTVAVPGAPADGGPAVAGQQVAWTITLNNAGPSTARGVTIADEIPAGVTIDTVTSAEATCQTADAITCSVPELAPSTPDAPTSVTVTINATVSSDYLERGLPGVLANTATATAATPDPTPNAATATVQVSEAADLTAVKTTDATEVVAGGTVTWKVTVTNRGPSDARDVAVADPSPAGVTFTDVAASVPGATCNLVASCELGSLAAGATAEITLVGTVDSASPAGATITNRASTTSATPDPVDGLDPVVETPVTTVSDLTITKRDATDPVVAGTSVYWSIEVRNEGPSDATNVVVADQVPDGVTVSSLTGDGATSCDVASGCSFPSIESGSSRVVSIVGTIANDYLASGRPNPVVNTASVATDNDPNPDNNSASEPTTIGGAAGLSISKSANVASATAGAPITWTLTVRNSGPSTATDVVVQDALPKGVKLKSIVGPDGSDCDEIDNCLLGDIGVGGSATITITATVDRTAVIDGVTELKNVATVTSATPDSDTSDNRAEVTTPVVASADLSLVKTAAGDVGAGGIVTWTLTVANKGPSTADGVTVTDTLPQGLKVASVKPNVDTVICDEKIVCDLGRVAPGQVIVITVTTTTPLDASTATFVNSANVASPTPDPDLSNNGAKASASALGAQIGLAKRLVGVPTHDASGTFALTFEFVVSNTGSANLSGVQVTDNLAARFSGVTSFTVTSISSDDLAVNADFDGTDDVNLLAGTDVLQAGATGVVTLTVDIVPGSAKSTVENFATASGSPATGLTVTDGSTDGPSVDPDGDGDPKDDAKPTSVSLGWVAAIGVAKELAKPVVANDDGSFIAVFDIDVRNFGDVNLNKVQVVDDLSTAFAAAAGFTVVSLTSDDLTINPNFNGVSDTKLLAGSDSLPVGRGGTLLLTTKVSAVSADQTFSNIANASAFDPSGAQTDDLSSAGSFGCDGDQTCDPPDVLPPDGGGDGGTVVTPPTTGAAPLGLIGVGLVLTGIGCLLVFGGRRRRSHLDRSMS